MFDQLVVSSRQRRRHTTGKFFLLTSTMYLFAIASAFVVSVLAFDPKLADLNEVTIIRLPATFLNPPPPPYCGPGPTSHDTTRPDYLRVQRFEDLGNTRAELIPPMTTVDHFGVDAGAGSADGPAGPPAGFGVIGGDAKGDAPPRPDPPKPKPGVQPTPDQKPMRVVSQILQGKAIERVVPVYPELMKKIRLQGDVSIEVIVSPDGRVESARAVSGHPMLASAAVDAARRWRFGPTLLNGIPVRVTGVIVFVFRLNE
ncbi:MAG TPA: energy transducer TonB [Blastocatellia bacterium]|nr:energy transducer TonB [Blastocatellia bacterium]